MAETGLTEQELRQAEDLQLIAPLVRDGAKVLYDKDDVRIGRDSLKKLMAYGLKMQDMAFYVELGRKIVQEEMALRRKIVAGRSMKENIRITAEISRSDDFFRDYVLRRQFQRQVRENIRKSLNRKKTNAP